MHAKTRWTPARFVALFVGGLVAGALSACGPTAPQPDATPSPSSAGPPVRPGGPAPAAIAFKPRGEIASILRDLAQWDAATSAERRAAAEAAQPLLHRFEFLRLETFTAGGASHEVAIYRNEATGLEFSLLPGGTFRMGSPPDERGRAADETPRTVRLTGPFLIGRTECTQAAWDRVMGSNASKSRGPDLPVESVSYHDAELFCAKARLLLPTEAQWEYACRAGTTTPYTSGDTPSSLPEFAWFGEPQGTTHPVGGRSPNAFGLFDVHGNVWEWCADEYGPRDGADTQDPFREPVGDVQRVVRGGAYATAAPSVRAAFRFRAHPADRQSGLGFRPIQPLERPSDWTKRR